MLLEYHSQQIFSGLTDEYLKSVFDQIFDLKIYGGFSIYETFNLPIGLRNYYTKRLSEKLQKDAENIKKINSKNRK